MAQVLLRQERVTESRSLHERELETFLGGAFLKTDVNLQNVLNKSINIMELLARAISPKDNWMQAEPETRISEAWER